MLTYSQLISVPGRRTTLEKTLTLAIPIEPITTCAGKPTAGTLNRFANACHATAVVVLVSGVCAISVVAHSDLQPWPKAGICVGSGLVMLGSYYCCKLSSTYAKLGIMLENFMQHTASDDMDAIDDFEEQEALTKRAHVPGYLA